MGDEMNSAVSQILAFMPPATLDGGSTPWVESASEIGIRFPSDYRDFVDHYGSGWINDELFVIAPTLRLPRGGRSGFLGMLDNTTSGLGKSILEMRENAVALEDDQTYPYPILPESGGLLMWGYNANTDICFWDTSQADQDRWEVVVFYLSGRRWQRFKGGMAEFLLTVLRGELAESARLIGDSEDGTPVWTRDTGWEG